MINLQDMRRPIESGCPDGMQFMHPVMIRNFGQWKYHEHPRPGVLVHHAFTGESVWTVKAGTQRILDVYTLRKLCDIGDQYADGHVRFTIRSNIEYMVVDEAKVEPLIEALEREGFIVGGTANSVAAISHTQGWLHCDIPGTDASGVVKAM
ncbi:MAG: dissimilatory-type sulfite reductase subunit beta, partial [Gammaproteobacteria bacterium]|nr:dissimilatory-type sulfite reductase subunit beta [Gammaproteobacteria bacterium]